MTSIRYLLSSSELKFSTSLFFALEHMATQHKPTKTSNTQEYTLISLLMKVKAKPSDIEVMGTTMPTINIDVRPWASKFEKR